MNWLEKYDAFTIYRLGKQGWSIALGKEGQKKIQDWENGLVTAFESFEHYVNPSAELDRLFDIFLI